MSFFKNKFQSKGVTRTNKYVVQKFPNLEEEKKPHIYC